MPRSFYSKVAGVSHKNPDGTSRQAALRGSWEDRPLILKREPNNPHDPSTIAVFTEDVEQLGYINSDLAEDLAPQMDRGVNISAAISEITGGDKNRKTLGCNILITVGDAGSDEIINLAPPKKLTTGCLAKCFLLVVAVTVAGSVLHYLYDSPNAPLESKAQPGKFVSVYDKPEKTPEELAKEKRLLLREAYDMAQVFVKRRLKSPATADFPGYRKVTVYPIKGAVDRYGIRGYADSQNGFGANIRTQYVCELQYMGGGNWRVTNLLFAP